MAIGAFGRMGSSGPRGSANTHSSEGSTNCTGPKAACSLPLPKPTAAASSDRPPRGTSAIGGRSARRGAELERDASLGSAARDDARHLLYGINGGGRWVLTGFALGFALNGEWRPAKIVIEREKLGQAAVDVLARELPLEVIGTGGKDKLSRAQPLILKLERGEIWLPKFDAGFAPIGGGMVRLDRSSRRALRPNRRRRLRRAIRRPFPHPPHRAGRHVVTRPRRTPLFVGRPPQRFHKNSQSDGLGRPSYVAGNSCLRWARILGRHGQAEELQ